MWKKKKNNFGSAVLTFIGYKQTNRQTDKPNLFIDYLLNGGNEFESFFQAEPDKIIRFLEFKTTLIKKIFLKFILSVNLLQSTKEELGNKLVSSVQVLMLNQFIIKLISAQKVESKNKIIVYL